MSNKNIVILRGGLGNQFYQLAALNYFLDKDQNLYRNYIDTSNFSLRKNSRQVEIDKIYKSFQMKFDYKLINEFKYSIYERIQDKIPQLDYLSKYSLLKNFEDLKKTKFLEKKSNKNIIFAGYFQKHEVAAKSPLSKVLVNNNDINDRKNILGIHIRFGDYLIEPFNKIYWKFNSEYLNKAIKKLLERYNKSDIKEIYIFTDSPNESKKILQELDTDFLYNCKYVSSKSSTNDLILLSNCNLKILSNSTYSLMSYYIGKSDFTIFPKQWYINKVTDPEIYPPPHYKGKIYII